MVDWKLEKRKLNDLKDYNKNPRRLSKHDAQHLQKSLEKFGLIDKPIVNPDGTIIGGHQRKRILKQMGYTEVECWVPDKALDDKQIQELNIRLNRNTGEWDWDILANEWDAGQLVDWGFCANELELDTLDESDDKEQKEDEKAKSMKKCPSCGHEFI